MMTGKMEHGATCDYLDIQLGVNAVQDRRDTKSGFDLYEIGTHVPELLIQYISS